MSLFDNYDDYIEKLLLAQFDVSETIKHTLTRGEVREDFLKSQIESNYPNISVERGLVTDGRNQSPQCDIIFVKSGARIRNLGNQSVIDVNDCLMILEIKTNAVGQDIRDFNTAANLIKNMAQGNPPIMGMFCYRINLSKRSLLNRFGYTYNREVDMYLIDEGLPLVYQNIDLFLSLHLENIAGENGNTYVLDKQIFLRKDTQLLKYILSPEKPVIKHFMNLLNSLYMS